ncbi:MAG: AbrB/MazE/SpoVT family DNA-binding domain-containing protein [Methanobacteriota archaeon]|nr:MAG: AbrB/MazE/SpoVT family DNA-binding domain-containing protein [Euryarchaeota archaeon]
MVLLLGGMLFHDDVEKTSSILKILFNVNVFGKNSGKMKVKVIAGKVYLPKEVRKEAKLLEGGEYEAFVVGDEIRIRPVQPEELNALRALKEEKKIVRAGIDEMMKAEAVDDA